MSKFADGYSRYLNHFYYTKKYKTLRKYFRNSVISLTDPNFITKTLIDNIDHFPKYPYFLNAFVRTDAIDLIKIFNSTMDNTDKLIDSMLGVEELGKKKLYDSIPSVLDQFLIELNFQFAYVATPMDLYNSELILKSFATEYQYRNFFSDLYSPLFYSFDQENGTSAGLENKSFLYQYMLYSVLYNLLVTSQNIYSKSLMYLAYINQHGLQDDRVDQSAMLLGFENFISNYHPIMSTDLAINISKSIYDFQKISTTILQNLKENIAMKINDPITGFYKSFYNFYYGQTSLTPISFLCNNFTSYLNAAISADIVSKIYSDNNIIDQEATIRRTFYEDDIYEMYMRKISGELMKNYLFLCFLYKFWPIKFLNILQLSMKEYVENLIKSPSDNLMTENEYGGLFTFFINNLINYPNLQNFLKTNVRPSSNLIICANQAIARFTFTPGEAIVRCLDLESYNAVNIHDYIYPDDDISENIVHVISKDPITLTIEIDNEYNGPILLTDIPSYRYAFSSSDYIYRFSTIHGVSEFACINYYIYLLEKYFTSEHYNIFVKELVENIFIYLRDNGHINYLFDWYGYHDIVKIYFKIFLRWKVLDQSRRCILPLQNNAIFKFTNNSNFVYCGNKESYDQILDGDYIFSEVDTIDNAVRVLSHNRIQADYILNLESPYTGTTTTNKFTIAYIFSSTDVPLFNNVTLNFSNKIIPKLLSNSTNNPNFDINIFFQNSNLLKDFFTIFTKSHFVIRSMHCFSENLALSTLTRETIYSIMSNFV